jgi:hypothetical protein
MELRPVNLRKERRAARAESRQLGEMLESRSLTPPPLKCRIKYFNSIEEGIKGKMGFNYNYICRMHYA